MNAASPRACRLHQRGVVLVVSLIVLLLMSLIGLASVRSAALEERMSGNWRDQNIALQAAEAALRAGETYLAPLADRPDQWTYPCAAPPCEVFDALSDTRPTEDGLLSRDAEDRSEWIANATPYGETLTGVRTPPLYLIEHSAYVRDHLVVGFGSVPETGRDQYRITARGTGQSGVSVSMLQTHYLKRFN